MCFGYDTRILNTRTIFAPALSACAVRNATRVRCGVLCFLHVSTRARMAMACAQVREPIMFKK